MENDKVEERKMMKKRYIIVPIIILVIIAIIGAIWYIKYNDNSYEIEDVKVFSYFKLYENKKYGVIDAKGNILIEAKYDNIDIPNPSKPVFIVYSNYDSQKGEYETQVINEKNEKILTQYEQVLPIILKESNSQLPYEKSVLIYKEKDKYGIINFNGKKITKPEYDSIESLLYKEGCLLVKKENKYGIVNIKGKEVVKPEYDSITADGYYDEETKYKKAGFIVGQKQNEGYRYGYINNNSEVLLKAEYNEINRVTEINDEKQVYLLAFRNGQAGIYKNKEQILKHVYEEIEYNKANEVFIVQRNEKQGVVSKEGKEILKTEYDYLIISGNKINAEKDQMLYIYDMNGNKQNIENNTTVLATESKEYFITINQEEKFGVINKESKTIIENKYQYIEYAFGDYFIATKEGKVGIIDKSGNVKIDFIYNVIQKIKNTNILQAIEPSSNISNIYNSKLEKVISMEDMTITVDDNVKLLSKNERQYLDKDGKILDNKEIFTDSKLFAFNKDEKWGFTDKEGNVKIEANYDMATELNDYGFAGIKKDGKWGVINGEGEIIVEPSYKVDWNEPDFIGQYLKLNFGYGFCYYTKEVE